MSSELEQQLDKLIYKDLLDWIPIDMADSAQSDGLVLHLRAIKKLLRQRDAEHKAALLSAVGEDEKFVEVDGFYATKEQINGAIQAANNQKRLLRAAIEQVLGGGE